MLTGGSTAKDTFATIILPSVFPEQEAEGAPAFTLVVGANSASALSAARVAPIGLGAPLLETGLIASLHPRYDEVVRAGDRDGWEQIRDVSASWVRDLLGYARSARRSVTLAGALTDPGVALGAIRRFSEAGFRTEVTLPANTRADDLLDATASAVFERRTRGRFALEALQEPRPGADLVAAICAAFDETPIADRVTVTPRGQLVGSGVVAFEAGRERGTATLSEQRSRPLSVLASAAFLSRLRRVTDTALEWSAVPTRVMDALIELHERAIEEVIPALRVPAGSDVFEVADHRLTRALVELKRVRSDRTTTRAGATGPSTAPTPIRGGLDR